jgi:hypothetical protein
VTQAWPWPGDNPTERARRIANSLLALLPAEEVPVWTARAHALGETWLGVDLIRWSSDDVLKPAEAARLVHRTTADLRRWVHNGYLSRTGRGYRAGDVIDAAAEARRRRGTRRRTYVARVEA